MRYRDKDHTILHIYLIVEKKFNILSMYFIKQRKLLREFTIKSYSNENRFRIIFKKANFDLMLYFIIIFVASFLIFINFYI